MAQHSVCPKSKTELDLVTKARLGYVIGRTKYRTPGYSIDGVIVGQDMERSSQSVKQTQSVPTYLSQRKEILHGPLPFVV